MSAPAALSADLNSGAQSCRGRAASLLSLRRRSRRLAGDLAGFRDCLEESWSGVKEDALTAYSNAQDTFDDVGNECLSALKIYARQLRSIFVHNEAAYEIARSLNVELMTSAFKKPPRYARQFAAADLAARDACKPT